MAGVSTLGVIGSSSAAADNDSPTAKEIGIADELQSLLLKNEVKKSEKILQEEGIKHEILRKSGNELTEAIGTEGYYSSPDGETELDLVILEYATDNRWLVSGGGTLADRQTSVRDAGLIPDALGLFFDVNEWTIDPTFDMENATVASSDAAGAFAELTTINLNEGTGSEIHLPDTLLEPTRFASQILLEKTGDSESAPVAMEYEHTWTTFSAWQDRSIQLILV